MLTILFLERYFGYSIQAAPIGADSAGRPRVEVANDAIEVIARTIPGIFLRLHEDLRAHQHHLAEFVVRAVTGDAAGSALAVAEHCDLATLILPGV